MQLGALTIHFAQQNVGIIPFDKMVESTIVVVSLQEPVTGGYVERATIERDGEARFWVPPWSIIHLLLRDFHFYSELLRDSVFFVCHGYPYEEELEVPLSLALGHRFPTLLRQHLISGGNLKYKIITFQGDPSQG